MKAWNIRHVNDDGGDRWWEMAISHVPLPRAGDDIVFQHYEARFTVKVERVEFYVVDQEASVWVYARPANEEKD